MTPHDFQSDIDLVADIPAVPRILKILTEVTRMRFAAVARVTTSRWVALSVLDGAGLALKPADELQIETTLCDQVRNSGELVHFDDAHSSSRYCGHIAPTTYGFRSYVSVPIHLPGGEFFGTLCGLDPEPREVGTEAVLGMFQLFAGMLGEQIATRRQLRESQSDLQDVRATAELRDQFIAVLGHDLRSPLASIQSCINLLEAQEGLEDEAFEFTRIARQNVGRMVGLIDNLLDLTRSQQGGALAITRVSHANLAERLHQVVEEVAVSHADRPIEARIDIGVPVACDVGRVCQLFANLLGNAATHGDAARPIRVEAHVTGSALVIAVANAGTPIDAAIRPRLFEPFVRSAGPGARQGLGLGLFIAQEIARTHGGTLSFSSDVDETRFVFRMPL